MFETRIKKQNGNINKLLYIHSFECKIPLKVTSANKFLATIENPKDLTCTADKLRYFRHKKCLLQREVADFIKVDWDTYVNYENVNHDYYKIENLYKIAELFEVDIFDLLDDYNLFLYNGQGNQIKQIRKSLGLSRTGFGKLFSLSTTTIKRWETENIKISKNSYYKLLEIVKNAE